MKLSKCLGSSCCCPVASDGCPETRPAGRDRILRGASASSVPCPVSDSGIPGFLESLEWAAAGAAWRGRAPRHCLPGAPAATTQLIRKFPHPAAAIPITAGEPAPGNREAAHPRGKFLCFGVSAREVVFVPQSPGKRPALLLVGVKASHIPQAPAKILIHPWAGALLPKEDGAKGIRKVGGEEE